MEGHFEKAGDGRFWFENAHEELKRAGPAALDIDLHVTPEQAAAALLLLDLASGKEAREAAAALGGLEPPSLTVVMKASCFRPGPSEGFGSPVVESGGALTVDPAEGTATFEGYVAVLHRDAALLATLTREELRRAVEATTVPGAMRAPGG